MNYSLDWQRQAAEEQKKKEAEARRKAEQERARIDAQQKSAAARDRVKATQTATKATKITPAQPATTAVTPYVKPVVAPKPTIDNSRDAFVAQQRNILQAPRRYASKNVSEMNYVERAAAGRNDPRLSADGTYWKALDAEINSPGSPLYNQYFSGKSTIPHAAEYLGTDTFGKDWLAENVWMKQYEQRTDTTLSLSTAGKKNWTPEQWQGYLYNQVEMAEEPTLQAESQFATMLTNLQDYYNTFKQVYGRAPTEAEFTNRINMDDYPMLKKIDESRNLPTDGSAAPVKFNRGVGYAKEYIPGLYYALSKGQTLDPAHDYFEDAVQYASGRDYSQYVQKKESAPAYKWSKGVDSLTPAQLESTRENIRYNGSRQELAAFDRALYQKQHPEYEYTDENAYHDDAYYAKMDQTYMPIIKQMAEPDPSGSGQYYLKSPGSDATYSQRMAYEYWQDRQHLPETQQLEKEWKDLRAFLANEYTYFKDDVNAGTHNLEESIVWTDFPLLQKYLEGTGKVQAVRPVYASKDAITGVIDRLRLGEDVTSDDVDYALDAKYNAAAQAGKDKHANAFVAPQEAVQPSGVQDAGNSATAPATPRSASTSSKIDLGAIPEKAWKMLLDDGLILQSEIDDYKDSQKSEPAEGMGGEAKPQAAELNTSKMDRAELVATLTEINRAIAAGQSFDATDKPNPVVFEHEDQMRVLGEEQAKLMDALHQLGMTDEQIAAALGPQIYSDTGENVTEQAMAEQAGGGSAHGAWDKSAFDYKEGEAIPFSKVQPYLPSYVPGITTQIQQQRRKTVQGVVDSIKTGLTGDDMTDDQVYAAALQTIQQNTQAGIDSLDDQAYAAGTEAATALLGAGAPEWAKTLYAGLYTNSVVIPQNIVNALDDTKAWTVGALADGWAALNSKRYAAKLGEKYTFAQAREIDPTLDSLAGAADRVSSTGDAFGGDYSGVNFGGNIIAPITKTVTDQIMMSSLAGSAAWLLADAVMTEGLGISLAKNLPNMIARATPAISKAVAYLGSHSHYFVRSYVQYADEARQMGATEKKASEYGVYGAGSEGIVEAYLGDQYSKIFSGAAGAAASLAKKAISGAAPRLADVGGALVDFLKIAVPTAIGEGVEEGAEVATSALGKQFILGAPQDWTPWGTLVNDIAAGRGYDAAKYSGTMVGTAIQNGTSAIASSLVTSILFGVGGVSGSDSDVRRGVQLYDQIANNQQFATAIEEAATRKAAEDAGTSTRPDDEQQRRVQRTSDGVSAAAQQILEYVDSMQPKIEESLIQAEAQARTDKDVAGGSLADFQTPANASFLEIKRMEDGFSKAKAAADNLAQQIADNTEKLKVLYATAYDTMTPLASGTKQAAGNLIAQNEKLIGEQQTAEIRRVEAETALGLAQAKHEAEYKRAQDEIKAQHEAAVRKEVQAANQKKLKAALKTAEVLSGKISPEQAEAEAEAKTAPAQESANPADAWKQKGLSLAGQTAGYNLLEDDDWYYVVPADSTETDIAAATKLKTDSMQDAIDFMENPENAAVAYAPPVLTDAEDPEGVVRELAEKIANWHTTLGDPALSNATQQNLMLKSLDAMNRQAEQERVNIADKFGNGAYTMEGNADQVQRYGELGARIDAVNAILESFRGQSKTVAEAVTEGAKALYDSLSAVDPVESQLTYDGMDKDVSALSKLAETAAGAGDNSELTAIVAKMGEVAQKIETGLDEARVSVGGGALLVEYGRRIAGVTEAIQRIQNNDAMPLGDMLAQLSTLRDERNRLTLAQQRMIAAGVTPESPTKLTISSGFTYNLADMSAENLTGLRAETEAKLAEEQKKAERMEGVDQAPAQRAQQLLGTIDEQLAQKQAPAQEQQTEEAESAPTEPVRSVAETITARHDEEIAREAMPASKLYEAPKSQLATMIDDLASGRKTPEDVAKEAAAYRQKQGESADLLPDPMEFKPQKATSELGYVVLNRMLSKTNAYAQEVTRRIDEMAADLKNAKTNAEIQNLTEQKSRAVAYRQRLKAKFKEISVAMEGSAVKLDAQAMQTVEDARTHTVDNMTSLSIEIRHEAEDAERITWFETLMNSISPGDKLRLPQTMLLQLFNDGREESVLQRNREIANSMKSEQHKAEDKLEEVNMRLTQLEDEIPGLTGDERTQAEAENGRLKDQRDALEVEIKNLSDNSAMMYRDSAPNLYDAVFGEGMGGRLPNSIVGQLIKLAGYGSSQFEGQRLHSLKSLLSKGWETNPKRIVEAFLGNDVGSVVNGMLFDRVIENNKNLTDDSNRIWEALNKSGITRDNAEIAHMYAEGKIEQAELMAQRPDDYKTIIKGVKVYRKVYDELFDEINAVFSANGIPPVPKRANYFPHFREGVNPLLSLLGLEENADSLPLGLIGKTKDFEPNKQFLANLLQRKGDKTDYNLLEGAVRYVPGALQIIHHTADIERIRQFERAIRDSDSFLNPNSTVAKNNLGNFVLYLQEYANKLAGKKSKFDSNVNRQLLDAIRQSKTLRGAALTAGNVSVMLSQTTGLVTSMAKAPLETVIALGQVLGNIRYGAGFFTGDGYEARSAYLTSRYPVKPLPATTYDAFMQNSQIPMEVVEHMASSAYHRAMYMKFRRLGYSDQRAMERADESASRALSSRVRGESGIAYDSVIGGAVLQFTREATNSVLHLAKDVARNRDGGLPALALYALLAWLWGKATNKTGAVDVIGGTEKAIQGKGENDTGFDVFLAAVGNIADSAFPIDIDMKNGSVNIPIVQGFTDLYSVGAGFYNAAFGDDDAMTKVEKIVTPVLGFVPFGGQAERTYRGVKALAKGYSESDAGNVRYPLDRDAWDYVIAPTLGERTTGEGRAYSGAGSQPLTDTRSDAFRTQVAAGLPSTEAYKNVIGTPQAKTATQAAKVAVKEGDRAGGIQQEKAAAQQRAEISIPSDMPGWAVTRAAKKEPEMTAAIEAYQQTGDASILPKATPGYVEQDGKRVEITPELQAEYEASYDTYYRARIGGLGANPTPDAVKKAAARAYEATNTAFINKHWKKIS